MGMDSTHYMKKDFTTALIFSYTSHDTVEAMPWMHLSDANQVESLFPRLLPRERGLMQWDAIEINAIADTDSALAKDIFCIAEGDYGIHLTRQFLAKKLVNL
jgi:hypothetical protein